MCKIVGFDLGNRYAKIYEDNFKGEMIVAWKNVKDEEYDLADHNDSVLKVLYKDNKYIFGDIGTIGITQKNKGDLSVREHSNIVKLIMLSKILNENKLKSGEFKIVTGTPYDDFEATKDDYISLMKSDEEESITINDEEYKIKVSGVHVTKQAACVILTLPERKTTNYLIWDFGGGTLDVSYYEKGARVKGQTVDFSLNEVYKKLGNYLNKYIPIDRPSLNDARFQKSMEYLILKGEYRGVTKIKYDRNDIELKQLVHDYLQIEVDNVVEQTISELNFNISIMNTLKNVFVGGGSKLLKEELIQNKHFIHKAVQENPEYSNALAYNKIGKVRKWE